MGYRIFYSFQSDINSHLNKNFIRNAINEAISKITDFQIEPLIEGFYGMGGNPPLTESMLKQSRESDIFIGDVTFTSSRIWQSPAIGFSEDANSITLEIAKPTNFKPAPNPNVLIETGYSWALKSFTRTILVMNTAFGDGKDLPVDMGSLRWPIGYNLSEERVLKPSKLKKERDKLVIALEEAIRDAIKSDIDYQIQKWMPCLVYSRWITDHQFPYHLTDKACEYIEKLRTALLNSKEPIRITGLPGSGKTRLIAEAFAANDKFDLHHTLDSFIYYDYESIASGDISKQLFEIKALNQRHVFVADNCKIEDHKSLVKYFKNTLVRVISINSVNSHSDTDGASLFIEENYTHEIFESIIDKLYPTRSATALIAEYDNNLESFVSLIESGLTDSDIDGSILESISSLIGEDNVIAGALKLLITVSLFERIGITGEYKNQVEFICGTFVGCSKDEVTSLIEVLRDKKLVKIKGDFITINTFKIELINAWIAEPFGELNDIIVGVSKNKMWHHFLEPFLKYLSNPVNLKTIKTDAGVLSNIEFIDREEGAQFLNMLAPYHPKEILEVMTKKVERL